MDVWCLRNDLHFVRVASSGNDYWVVKDPLARECHYVNEDEKKLLEMADGSTGIQSVCRQAMNRFPDSNSLQSLLSFFVQARRRGLLIAESTGPLENALRRAPSQSRTSWGLASLLAIRLPGWNPSRLLRLTESVFERLTSRAARWLGLALMCVAGLVLVGRFDRFVAESVSSFRDAQGSLWLLILLVIASVKTIHELAHAMTCRWAGAECRRIGVLLLLGTPCLYCDVTDLWSVPDKWKRVLVSAAGMMAELLIAAVATLVWASTGDTTLHEIALMVMVVCSFSTLLINANPLLRYDGYFMLADALGVPNLATVAGDRLRSLARSVVWGIQESPRCTLVGRRLSRGWLYMYAIASVGYRCFVLCCILLAIYHAGAAYELDWLLLPLCLIFVAGFIARPIANLIEPPTTVNEFGETVAGPQWYQHKRARRVLAAISLVFVTLLSVPLPRNVYVPVVIVAHNSAEVYAQRSGTVTKVVESSEVQTGAVVVQLRDDELEDRLMDAVRSLAEAETILETLQRNKSRFESSADQIAVAEQRMTAARMDVQQLSEIVEQLAVRTPRSGRFTVKADASPIEAGQLIVAGTMVGRVGDVDRRAGYGFAAPDQIALLKPGQSVTLLHPSIRVGAVGGSVLEVNTTPTSGTPVEIAATFDSIDDGQSNYAVQIEWDSENGVPLPKRTPAIAKINVGKASLWSRFRLWLVREFSGGV